jgi:hypothetical protein
VKNFCVSVNSHIVGSAPGRKRKIGDIPAKKTNFYSKPTKRLISGVFGNNFPGITDIAAKKKIKSLTFNFCCVNKKHMRKQNNTGNGETDVFYEPYENQENCGPGYRFVCIKAYRIETQEKR